MCKGILVSDSFVITAAQCLLSRQDLKLISLGSKDYPQNVEIASITIHPGANRSLSMDIAIIKMAEAVTFDQFIKPICLTGKTTNEQDEWFAAKMPQEFSTTLTTLLKVAAEELLIDECNELMGPVFAEDFQICIVFKDVGKRLCDVFSSLHHKSHIIFL